MSKIETSGKVNVEKARKKAAKAKNQAVDKASTSPIEQNKRMASIEEYIGMV